MRHVVVTVVAALLVPGALFADSKAEHRGTPEAMSRPAAHEIVSRERDDHGTRGNDSHREHEDRDLECKKPAPSTLLQGLVSYWKLDGSSSDSVGGNTGADTAITYGAQYGFLGQGALFDGVSSGVGFGSPANLNLTGDMSIAMWVYPLSLVEGSSVFAKTVGVGDSDNAYDLQVFADARLQFVYANGTYYYINSATILPSNTWSHVVFTRGNNNADTVFYVNGVNVGLSNNHWAAITPLSSGDVFLGRRGNGNFFHGYLDEVGVWNRVLTPAEVTELYNGGIGKTYPF